MMLGSYILDSFNNDSKLTKLFSSLILLFFGGILVIYEITIADKVAKWWDNSELNFLYNVYILKSFDNKPQEYVEAIERAISAEKNKNSKLFKHLTVILKRNEHTK